MITHKLLFILVLKLAVFYKALNISEKLLRCFFTHRRLHLGFIISFLSIYHSKMTLYKQWFIFFLSGIKIWGTNFIWHMNVGTHQKARYSNTNVSNQYMPTVNVNILSITIDCPDIWRLWMMQLLSKLNYSNKLKFILLWENWKSDLINNLCMVWMTSFNFSAHVMKRVYTHPANASHKQLCVYRGVAEPTFVK